MSESARGATVDSATPGPWRVVARTNAKGQELTPAIVGKRSWGGSREWPIAVASAISKNETDANARLIAAAPELLEALEIVKGMATAMRGEDFNLGYEQWKKVNAAIDKARGNEQT